MARLVREETTSFNRAMIDDLAATRYPRDAVALLENSRIEPDGTARRRDGSIRTHPTALVAATAIGYGAEEYTKADGTLQIVAFFDNKFFISEDGGATWTDKTPVSPAITLGYFDFAQMRIGATNYLFAANGATEVWRWDGTTLDPLPNVPSGVKFVEVFNDRLAIAGHSGIDVDLSRVHDPTGWTIPFKITVRILAHGDENTVRGLYQSGDHLLVYGRRSTAMVDGFGEQSIVVAVGPRGFSRSVGCTGFRTIRGVGENAVCWLSSRGIEYYHPGEGIRLLTRPGLQEFLKTIDRSLIEDTPGIPTAAYDDITQHYFLALPTTGNLRNNQVVAMNLLQRGQGWIGAPSIDKQRAQAAGTALFFADTDADDYLDVDAAGMAFGDDGTGYAQLVATGGIPTIDGGDGYLTSNIVEQMASTLFVASRDDCPCVLYSQGYDGFVRRHDDGDLDDRSSDGTGGIDVIETIVGRPFLMNRPSQRKRARFVHLASIQDAAAEFTIAIRADGVLKNAKTKSFPATQFNQPKRRRIAVKADGDAPQVVLTTKSRARVALLGLSGELLRERSG